MLISHVMGNAGLRQRCSSEACWGAYWPSLQLLGILLLARPSGAVPAYTMSASTTEVRELVLGSGLVAVGTTGQMGGLGSNETM